MESKNMIGVIQEISKKNENTAKPQFGIKVGGQWYSGFGIATEKMVGQNVKFKYIENNANGKTYKNVKLEDILPAPFEELQSGLQTSYQDFNSPKGQSKDSHIALQTCLKASTEIHSRLLVPGELPSPAEVARYAKELYSEMFEKEEQK